MPLTILVPMILVALPLIIVTVYLVGNRKPRPKLNEQFACERFNLDFPGTDCQRVFVDDPGKTALIAQDGVMIGLVTEIGQNFITRKLDKRIIKSVKETGDGIDLWFHDFTLKHVRMDIANAEVRAMISERMRKPKVNHGSDNS